MERKSISLCMIVLNEERCLARALGHVKPYVDEIVIIDGGSTDKSILIAKRFNARVIHSPWKDDFAKQRNISLKYATKRWVLVIDADEIYEKKLLQELQKLANNNIGIDAFAFPRKNYIDNRLTKAYPDRQVRFFHNSRGIRYQRRLHEIVVGHKRIAALMDLHIIHRKTSSRQREQNRHYKVIERLIKGV